VPASLTDRQRLDWLRLIRSENVGPRTFSGLLRRFGSAAAALDALPDLARKGGATRPLSICSPDQARRELDTATRHGIAFVALGEAGYPADLRHIADPPPLLSIAGNRAALDRPMVAIVGARNASALGMKFAGMIAAGVGAAGYVVASGLARGIDTSAHQASLSTGTVAALAGGLLRIYPPENERLADDILTHGALISEMPLDFPPRGQDFPRRNRLVAGLSRAVVVIEAAARSGSLSTARMAAEQGREVLAAPGSPLDPRCEGTNRLIRSGAAIVTSVEDVLEALDGERRRAIPQRLETPDEPVWEGDPEPASGDAPEDLRRRLVDLLGPAPVAVDDLVRLTGSPAGTVRGVLIELSLAGRLSDHGPAGYALLSPA
jgi:DNA processing protein